MSKLEIESLERAKNALFNEWSKLNGPANAVWKKYENAREALRDAVLYEKAKRQVLRDLIKTAGAKGVE